MNQDIKVPGYLTISKIIAYIMYAWVFFGTIILGLRVFLLAFSANASTPFVDFVYRTSADYLAPFRGIFPAKTVGETGYLDIAAIFAIIIYLLIGWGFATIIHYIQAKIDVFQENEKQRLIVQQKSAVRSKTTK